MERAVWLRERMDDPECDPVLLENTYAQFATINRLVAGWGPIVRSHLRPRLSEGSTILDVGCGGGDLVRRLARWGLRNRLRLRITALDTDRRALDFAESQPQPPGIEYLHTSAEELLAGGRRFDVVLSNHLLHHIAEANLSELLETTGALGRNLVLHNDLRRSRAALIAFSSLRPLFRRSFIVEDGLRSIRRAFTPEELREIAPRGWRVESALPFRNIVILER